MVDTVNLSSTDQCCIYFIPYLQSALHKFDINTLTSSLFLNPEDATLGYGPHLLALDSTHIFIQGGVINAEFIADSFILNLETLKLEEKPYGPINAGGACIVFSSKVYIFGGAKRDIYEPSDQSQLFDLDSELWESLPPIPTPSYNNTCAQSFSSIYIVGQHLKTLIQFDPCSQVYSQGIQLSELYKLIMSCNDILYVITPNSIRVFENQDWTEHPNNLKEQYTIIYSYTVQRGEFIYFIVPPRKILRLNIVQKMLECIENLE